MLFWVLGDSGWSLEWRVVGAFCSLARSLVFRTHPSYLASGNLRDANKLFQLFLDASPDMPDTPLCNFLKFLLLTLERDAYPLFEVLRRKVCRGEGAG